MVSSDETEEIISSDEVISEVTLSTSETSVAVPGVETEGALEDVLDDVAAGFDAHCRSCCFHTNSSGNMADVFSVKEHMI